MSMYGADVAGLRSLAAQFDRTADQLDASRMAVGNAIQVSAWVGPFATQFRVQWGSEHSARIRGAVSILQDAARSLRRNADDQDRASAVDGDAGAGPANMPVLPKLFPWLNDTVQGWRPEPAKQHPFAWLNDTVMGWKPADGMPLLGAFDFGFMVSKVPGLGNVVTGISMADVFVDPEASIADKLWAAGGGFVDAASGAAKALGPIGYLAGVASAQVWDVVDLASHADFSPEGVQTTWDFMMTNPSEALEGAAEGIVSYIPDLIDNLWPW